MDTLQRVAGVVVADRYARSNALRKGWACGRQIQLQLPVADQLEDRLSPGEREGLVFDDADALASSLDELLASAGPGHVAHRALTEPRCQKLVAG